MKKRTNLIIGAACGYEVEHLRPFVHSYSLNCDNAECFLIIDVQAPPVLVSFLEDAGITCVRVNRKPPWLRRNASKLFMRAIPVTVLERLRINRSIWIENAILAFMRISSSRYFVYQRIVRENEWANNVLLTDTRDVVFTGDIFSAFDKSEGDYLRIALESETHRIKDEENNSRWIKKIYGEECFLNLKENRISCSGTTLGTRNAILLYLSKMTSEMTKFKRRIRRDVGWDQGIHNVLLWEKKLGTVECCENKVSDLATIGLGDAEVCRFDPSDFSASWHNGAKINLLHQFDRHDHLLAKIESTLE